MSGDLLVPRGLAGIVKAVVGKGAATFKSSQQLNAAFPSMFLK
jgi:hypothetical protein